MIMRNYMKFISFFSVLLVLNNLSAQVQVEHWMDAMTCFKENDYHGAITSLNKYLQVVPGDQNAYYNRGISKLNLGDYSGACEDITFAESSGFKSGQELSKFLCDTTFRLNMLKKQFYSDDKLYPENNYRPLYTKKDSLRGALRPERTCFDVYYYNLSVKIIPKGKKIEGENKIYFHAINQSNTIQIDLFENYTIEDIIFDNTSLQFKREYNAVFIRFPFTLVPGKDYSISVKYSGKPHIAEKPPWQGGFVWEKDKKGNLWAGVACEHLGASSWWPNKDHLSDEPDSMQINISVPAGYTAVSNGVLRKKIDEGRKNTRFEWFVNNPINNYNVTFYLGEYAYFEDSMQIDSKNLLLKYYVLPYNLEKAKSHFQQTKEVLEVYNTVYGSYPFMEDGFGLVESPYEGMEHQTAIAYGYGYTNDNKHYLKGKDYDYIIIHEAAHEWWGNAVSAADMADIWLHEGFATYSELLFIEKKYGKEDYDKEAIERRKYIFNFWPLVENYDVNENSFASSDVYNKGATTLYSLRCCINNDSLFFNIIQEYFEKYKHKTTTTNDFINLVNERTGQDYTSFFEKYLYEEELPILSYSIKTDDSGNLIFKFRWDGVKDGFTMPFAVHTNDGNSLRFIATTEDTEVTLEGIKWFNFYNEWQEIKNVADNSLTYFRTKWID